MVKIQESEFKKRIEIIQLKMEKENLDAVMVYGDEYRKENLRYVCNFWPIFERGALFIPKKGEPIYAGAPEGENYVKEMGVWSDVRNIADFACVSVPEEIHFPLVTLSSLGETIEETLKGGKNLGIIGMSDIPVILLRKIESVKTDMFLTDASDLIYGMRLIKEQAEIACLREAGRQACEGYKRLMEYAVPGNTERLAAAAGESAARMAGAEAINFTIFCSEARTNTMIGRDTDKVIEDGDMIMACLAVQYEGYTASAAYPFVAGRASDRQQRFLSVLFEASDTQLNYLREGEVMGGMVKAVRNIFKREGLDKYDIYPPLHGIGLAEAESPYPNEKTSSCFKAGMTVNSDISLFGHCVGSNRIEEGFVITKEGWESLTPYVRELCAKGI